MRGAEDAAPITRKGLVWRGIMGAVHLLYTLVWPTRVTGRDRVPSEGPALIAANHQSFLDIPLIAKAAHHRHLAFVARESLARSRVLAFVMRRCGAILIDPAGGDRSALRRMAQVLKQGGVVVIFPEGTRTRSGKLGEPKKGAVIAARQAGAPIIPCAIDGSFAAWPPDRKLPRPGRLRVAFAEPVPPDAKDALGRTWGAIAGLLGDASQKRSGEERAEGPSGVRGGLD